MTTLLKCPRRLVVFLLAVTLLCMNAYAVETEEEPGDSVTVIADVVPESEPEIPDDKVVEETIVETEPESIAEDLIEDEAEEEPVVDEFPDDLYQAYVVGCLFFFVIVTVFYFSYKFFAMFF